MSTPLGDFLRTRRDATPPQALGLAAGSRRRAPGVRRSELAGLAGISVEYLTRIEQGRDRNPSPPVVNSLADALRLDPAEREYLRHLTKVTGGGCGCGRSEPSREVRPGVLRVLEHFEPGAALVVNPFGDLLAYTSGFDLLARPTGLLDDERPSLIRFVFTDARSREVFPGWDALADELAFDLWNGGPPESSARLRAELTRAAGAEFTRRLHRFAVPRRGALRWVHPEAGDLLLDREFLELPAADAQRVVVLLPADDATADALARLRARAGRPLRAVT